MTTGKKAFSDRFVQKTEITFIMPALNEAQNIELAITNAMEAFQRFGIQGEILVINDGSTDQTGHLIDKAIAQYGEAVRVVTHARPMGIGASFWGGVDSAKGELVVMMPGDNENDPDEILRYHKLLNHVDLVIPFVYNKQVRSLFRNFLSLSYRFIINTTFGVYFNYTNGTILYRRSVLQTLTHRSRGFFFQTDILIRLVKAGYLFAEVPYRLSFRKKGISKAVSFPSLLQVMKGYLRLVKETYFEKKSTATTSFSKGSQTAERRTES